MKKFNGLLIKFLTDDISSNTDSYYAFAGKLSSWDDEDNPEETDLSLENSEFKLRNEILFGKKIDSLSYKLLVNNNIWEQNTAYAMYDHRDTDLYSKNFYVRNSADNVYKCLFNNDSGPSLNEPQGISNTSFQTLDGYIWKYMYSLTSTDIDSFATDQYIPVTANTDVKNSAIPGTIDVVLVENKGSGYTIFNTGSIQSVVSNTIFRIENTGPGTNNVFTDSAVYIETGTGSGSISKIVSYTSNSSGKFIQTENPLTLDNSSEYIISPRVTITGDGSGAFAYSTVDLSKGQVNRIFVQNTGSNYTFANVVISCNTIHGSGATGTAIISPLEGHGSNTELEFGAENLAITVKFIRSESNTIPQNITFRQAGLIRNPVGFNSNNIIDSLTFNQTVSFDTTYIASTPFQSGETIVGLTSNASAEVITANLASTICYMSTDQSFISGETVLGSNSNISATITNLNDRDINKYSGDILYYTNFEPITRSNIASETIKLIVKI